jgi:hypothetical protein
MHLLLTSFNLSQILQIHIYYGMEEVLKTRQASMTLYSRQDKRL